MYALMIPWLIAWGAVPAPKCGQTPKSAPAASAPASADGTVAVKRIDPVQLVFVEHHGPYWAVGPALARVREHMLKHAQAGPMFVRYLTDPLDAGQRSLSAQVGFVAKGGHRPEPPFEGVQRSNELVAYTVVEGRSPAPRRDYPVIREWIQAHGYVVAGPVTEIYETTPPDRTAGPQRTEIQVTLRAVQPGENLGVRPIVGAPPTPVPVLLRQTTIPGASDVKVGKIEVHADATTSESEAATGPDVEPKPGASTEIRQEESTGTVVAEASTLSIGVGEAGRIEPVRQLIATGQFDRIAEQLMPEGRVIPDSDQLWLGHVVFRIGAVAKGIQQVYPRETRVAGAMADAVTRRYKKISAGFQADPLGQAVVRVDVQTDPLADRKRAIMRDVDSLLGRIAFRSVGAEAATDELAEILQRVQDLMWGKEATSRRAEELRRQP